MCYQCVAQKQNSKGTIGREKNHLKSDESELRDKIKEGGVRLTLLVLTCIHIRGSKMFSPAPQSLSLGRWRASELGDDEWQSWEMTEGRTKRWRVWQSKDDECEAAVDTSKRERRWRKGRGRDGECEAVVDASKRERRWRKGVLWDDVEWEEATPWFAESSMSETSLCVWVRHQHLYGWDTDTCMGETPQQLCEVIQAAHGSRETFR